MKELDPTYSAGGENSAETKSVRVEKGAEAAEVRRNLVDKFRNVLDNGTYEVKANEIAEKMVQKIRENKNRHLL